MAKIKSKQELQQLISKADLLTAYTEEISRQSQDAAKRSQEQAFAKEAHAFVADQRDVILIAIKIK